MERAVRAQSIGGSEVRHIILRNKVACQSHVNNIDAVNIDVGISALFGVQHALDERSYKFGGTFATMAPGVGILSASKNVAFGPSVACSRHLQLGLAVGL